MFIYVIIRIKDTGKKLTISLTVAFVHIFQEKKNNAHVICIEDLIR